MSQIPFSGTRVLRALALPATVIGLALASVVASPERAATYPSGSPGGFDGSSVDNGIQRTCATSGCHDSYPLNSGTGNVSVSVPGSVQPGQTVPVTVTVVNTTTPAPGSATGRRQGFEVAAKTADGQIAGTSTITDAANTRLTFGSDVTVTHRTPGALQSSWTFDWTAPNSPATVTFTAAGNAANGGDLGNSGNNAAGDYIYTASRIVQVGSVAAGDTPDASARIALGAPHPNPVRTGAAALRLTLGEAADVTVRIVDGRGRTVRTVASAPRSAGETAVMVRTDGLAPGLYFVIAEAGALRSVQPLTVAR